MADINNVQLNNHVNSQLRPLANQMLAIQRLGVAAQKTYNARDLGTIITNAGASNLVADGSEVDGRTRATGGDVFNLQTLLADFATFMTSDRIDVLFKFQTGPNGPGG